MDNRLRAYVTEVQDKHPMRAWEGDSLLEVLDDVEDHLNDVRASIQRKWTRASVDAELGRLLLEYAQAWSSVSEECRAPASIEEIPSHRVDEFRAVVAEEWLMELLGVLRR